MTEQAKIYNEATEVTDFRYIGEHDVVNHPRHYISKYGLESIDVIKAFTSDLTGFEAVATANSLKYLMRWKNKNGIEDLRKASWYIEELISFLETGNE